MLGPFPNNRKLRKYVSICIAPAILAIPNCASANTVSVGAHVFWYRGPVRSMALSGATVGETVAGSLVDNPAAMAHQTSVLSSTLNYGEPLDTRNKPPATISSSQGFKMLGASIMPSSFYALGATYQTLNFSSTNRPDSTRTLQFSDTVSEIDFAAAIKFSNRLAIGGAMSSGDSARKVDLNFSTGEAFSAQSRAAGTTTLKLGMQSQLTESLSFGVYFREHSKFTLSQSGSESLQIFSSSYHPQVIQLGTVYRPFTQGTKLSAFSMKNFAVATQLDHISFPSLPNSGKIYSGPGSVFGTLSDFELSTRECFIPRVGLELPMITTWIFSTYTRVGAYYEPAYLAKDHPRAHTTAGALVRIWYLAFEGAVDVANGYQNWSYGVSLDFNLR